MLFLLQFNLLLASNMAEVYIKEGLKRRMGSGLVNRDLEGAS